MYLIFFVFLFCLGLQGGPKLKLYTDEDGHVKGDGLCCYLKVGGWWRGWRSCDVVLCVQKTLDHRE